MRACCVVLFIAEVFVAGDVSVKDADETEANVTRGLACVESDRNDCPGTCCENNGSTTLAPSSTNTRDKNAIVTTTGDDDAEAFLRCPCENGRGSIFKDYCLERQPFCAVCDKLHILNGTLCVHYLEMHPGFPVGEDARWFALWSVFGIMVLALFFFVGTWVYTYQAKRKRKQKFSSLNANDATIPELNVKNRVDLSALTSPEKAIADKRRKETSSPHVFVYSPTSKRAP